MVKACAAAGDHVRGPQRHLEDLARLYRLVTDPGALTLTAKDRKRLRGTAEPTWEVLDDPGERAAGRAARRLFTTRQVEVRRPLGHATMNPGHAQTNPPSTLSTTLYSLSSPQFAQLQ